jgi:hypothetical protein
MLGQALLLMQITFLNNVRKIGRLVLSRTSCSELKYSKSNLRSRPTGEHMQSEFPVASFNIKVESAQIDQHRASWLSVWPSL